VTRRLREGVHQPTTAPAFRAGPGSLGAVGTHAGGYQAATSSARPVSKAVSRSSPPPGHGSGRAYAGTGITPDAEGPGRLWRCRISSARRFHSSDLLLWTNNWQAAGLTPGRW